MGQVNLYKIDEKKTDDFLNKLDEKFQFLGEQYTEKYALPEK